MYVEPGSRWISSQVHVVGRSTSPSTEIDQLSGSILGVASAVRTGQPLPVSYWPGWQPALGPASAAALRTLG